MMGVAVILAIGLTIAAVANLFRPDSSGGGFTEEDRWNLHCIWQRTITIMAQLDDLLGILSSISSDVDTTLSQVSALESQLQALQNSTPPEVDLSAAISAASSIRQRLEGTQTNISNADTSTPRTRGFELTPAQPTLSDVAQPGMAAAKQRRAPASMEAKLAERQPTAHRSKRRCAGPHR
jgi:hypothetical protein